MIHYPNGFDPVETNGVYANDNGYDIVRPCKNNFEKFARENAKPDCLKACNENKSIDALTYAARSKEILVNVPSVYQTPRIEIIPEEWLTKEFLPKLKNEKVENEMDITKLSLNELTDELARRKENEQLHLNHDFYKRAAHYREMERYEQIIKGAHKYPTPFEPMEWSPKQLLQHAMQENVDQAHYIYGLYEHLEKQENQIANLKQENEVYKVRGDAYSEQLKDIGRLTKYMVEEFPEAGRAGQLSVDVAIELLKEYKKAHNYYNEIRQANTELLTELNGLAKYLIVHYPHMVDEGRWATGIAKEIMDLYRNGEDFNAKG